MFGYGMRNLVAHHDSQPCVILGDGKDARVDGDFSPGHAPGIRYLIILNQIEFPFVIPYF